MNRTLSGDVRYCGGELEISQCAWCRHRNSGGRTCRAFPDGIPKTITENNHDHRHPFKGDRGVRFEPEVVEIESADVVSAGDSIAPTAELAIAMAPTAGEPDTAVGPAESQESAENVIALQGVDFELVEDEVELEMAASV